VLSIQDRSRETFQIVLTEMAMSKKWTRAERLSLISPGVAILAAIAAWGVFLVNRANRQDSRVRVEQTQLTGQIDNRIDTKLGPIINDIEARKNTEGSLKTDIDGFKVSLREGLGAARTDIDKVGDVARSTQQAVSEMKGQMQRLEKDVDLLLQRQLKAFADLPAATLAAQIPNMAFLYQMASQRKIEIPSETNNSIRTKLASIDSGGSEF
jgi:hypothetical protein